MYMCMYQRQQRDKETRTRQPRVEITSLEVFPLFTASMRAQFECGNKYVLGLTISR